MTALLEEATGELLSSLAACASAIATFLNGGVLSIYMSILLTPAGMFKTT